MSVAYGSMKETFLPPEHADKTIVCPTLNRWGEGRVPGAIHGMLESVQHRLMEAGFSDQSRILIGDATHGTRASLLRAFNFSHATTGMPLSTITKTYSLTPELQERVAEEVRKRTGFSKHIIDAILIHTGYASQRVKLDVVARGKVLTFDDDTTVPETYPQIRPEYLPQNLRSLNNSQVLIQDGQIPQEGFRQMPNSIVSFFEYLGRTIEEMRKSGQGPVRATKHHRDTMNDALRSSISGDTAQFEVSFDGPDDVPDAERAMIVAATPTKYGNPDYRTVAIARAHLRDEFPSTELPVQSVLSGEPELFAFQQSKTNVDSAAFARNLDERTSQFPWWYVSSDEISRRNPLQTVTGHYRADNELLPMLLGTLSSAWDRTCMYVSGLQTQVYHNRARSGYRPGIHEQATASLVGNIAATESAKRLHIDPSSNRARMDEVESSYEVPEDFALRVYEEIKTIADICMTKIVEIQRRKSRGPEEARAFDALVGNYRKIYEAVESKLAGFSFSHFHNFLNTEIRDQMRFYKQVLAAYPIISELVQSMVQEGRYPVEEFVPSATPTTVYLQQNHGLYPARSAVSEGASAE